MPPRYKVDLSVWFPPACESITFGYSIKTDETVWLYRTLSDPYPMELEPPTGEATVMIAEQQTIYISCEPSEFEFWQIGCQLE